MTALILSYHLASRLVYVLGVGFALTQQDRHQLFTRRRGVQAGFRRFRRIATALMSNDALSFILLCVLTRQTPHPGLSWAALWVGLPLLLLGITTKLWATARLGWSAYYWHNFFVADRPVPPEPPGPYRFLKNPMYTIGYLHMYGFALVLGSLPGLIAAGFDHTAILAFYYWVEKPHFDLLTVGGSRRQRARAT